MKTTLTLLLTILAIPVLSQNRVYDPSNRKLMYLPAKPTDTVIGITPYYMQPRKKPSIPKTKKWEPDTIAYKRFEEALRGSAMGSDDHYSPIDRMPNAIRVDSMHSSDVFAGNNGHGFDIYESTLDRMPILKPDTTNQAARDKWFKGTIPPGKIPQLKIVPVPKQ